MSGKIKNIEINLKLMLAARENAEPYNFSERECGYIERFVTEKTDQWLGELGQGLNISCEWSSFCSHIHLTEEE